MDKSFVLMVCKSDVEH